MNQRTTRRHAFLENFLDAVTVRPFLQDLSRIRRGALALPSPRATPANVTGHDDPRAA